MEVIYLLLLGMVVGYLLSRRTNRIPSSGAFLVKWPEGIGRCHSISVGKRELELNMPITRTKVKYPTVGEEVILRAVGPESKGLRGEVAAVSEESFTVRLA